MGQRIFQTGTNDPQEYYWFREALTKEEVDKILAIASELPDQRGATLGQEGESVNDVRSSVVKWIPNTWQFDWLYQKMMDLANEANEALWGFELISALENIQYTEYYASENGHYDWHQDIGPGELPSKRKVSITIQLTESEDYIGGDLEICYGSNGFGQLDNVRQTPRGAGVGVLFPSYMMHRVSPVTQGVRRSLVLWVGGSHYK